MPDGVHPSAKGHQLLSSCVLASVDNLTGHDRQLKGKEMVVEAIKADDSTIMPSLDAKAQQEHMVNLKDADSADAYKEAERVEQVPQHSVPSSPPTGPLVPWAESGSSFKGLQDHRPELGEWSSCSKSCGVGMRRREVRCNTANGQVQADTVPCPHSFEAWELQQPCNLLPCNLLPDTAPPAVVSTEAHWVPGAWMECQDEVSSKPLLSVLMCLREN